MFVFMFVYVCAFVCVCVVCVVAVVVMVVVVAGAPLPYAVFLRVGFTGGDSLESLAPKLQEQVTAAWQQGWRSLFNADAFQPTPPAPPAEPPRPTYAPHMLRTVAHEALEHDHVARVVLRQGQRQGGQTRLLRRLQTAC